MTKQHQPTDPHAELVVEQIGGDRWEWRYVEREAGVELHSNENYATAEKAAEWARRAYPDLSVAGEDD